MTLDAAMGAVSEGRYAAAMQAAARLAREGRAADAIVIRDAVDRAKPGATQAEPGRQNPHRCGATGCVLLVLGAGGVGHSGPCRCLYAASDREVRDRVRKGIRWLAARADGREQGDAMTPRPWQGPTPEPSALDLARGWRWVRDGRAHALVCGDHWCADAATDSHGAAWQAWRARGRDVFAEDSVHEMTLEQAKAAAVEAANECGEWGHIVVDEPMCSRADFDAKVVEAERKAAEWGRRVALRSLIESREFRRLQAFIKTTAHLPARSGALSAEAGGHAIVVDYSMLRYVAAEVERIGGDK